MFQYVISVKFDFFNKHVERDFLQHGLGTPYSNSACFDKDDIWTFLQFLVQCMSASLSPAPSLHLKLNLTGKQISSRSFETIYWSLKRRTKQTNKKQHSTPSVIITFRFSKEKKKWRGKYFIFKGGWRNSCDCKCILFQYCWQNMQKYSVLILQEVYA